MSYCEGCAELLREKAALKADLEAAKEVVKAARSTARYQHYGDEPPKDCIAPLCIILREYDARTKEKK